MRDLRTLGGDGANAGEAMGSVVPHYTDGSLRPETGDEEIGAFGEVRFDDGLPVVVSPDSIPQGRLVNFWDGGGGPRVRVADQSTSRPAHGWIVGGGTAGQVARVRLTGSANDTFSGLTIGATYYLAEDGTIDDDDSITPARQVVGVAANASTLIFLPELPMET